MQKIAIVTRCMESGGAERVIWRLLHYAAAQGYKTHLILMEDWHRVFYTPPQQCNMQQIHCKTKRGPLRKLESYLKLRKTLMQLKPDIVLSMPEEIGIYVLLALFGTKLPVVVSERNNPWLMPNKKITRLLRTLMYPHATGLIFQTKQAASFFSEKLQQKGIILPNPLDTDALPDVYHGAREKIVVGTGRLAGQKNFPLLIDAFAEFYCTHPDYKLIIYGDGLDRAALEARANAKALPEGTITLPGKNTNLLHDLRTKAMFVLSSDFEGMPNVVIEAMAMGVPTISTDCPSGGSAALIKHGESGLLTPVGDVQSMVGAMCQIADDAALADKLSRNSPYVRQMLDSNVVCRQWLQYLEKCSNAARRQLH